MSSGIVDSDLGKSNQKYTTVERGIERYETGSGRRYRVRYLDGSGAYRSRSVPTLKEARRIQAENRITKAAGGRLGRSRSVRLLDFAEGQWLEEQALKKEEAGLIRDLSVLDNHVLPTFGARPLSEIDTQDVAAWKSQLLRDGVGPPTVRIALGILSSIMKTAAVWHRETGVVANPVAIIERPSGRRLSEPTIWHPIVTNRLWWILRHNSIRQKTGDEARQDALLVSFCSLAGMRPGEVIALKWSDIDFQNDQIFIRRAVSLEKVKTTKTLVKRTVPLLGTLKAELEKLKAYRAGRAEPSVFIFEKADFNHWNRTAYRNFAKRHLRPATEYVEKTWKRFATELEANGGTSVPADVGGISEARLYDLGRHSHSALMLSSGVNLIRLATIQGHSIKTLSDNYSQYMAGLSSQASSDPDQMLAAIRVQVESVSEAVNPAISRRQISRQRLGRQRP